MTPELKDRWSARLRSNTYTQINGALSDNCSGRCALGVLCEVAGITIEPVYGTSDAYKALDDIGLNMGMFWTLNDIEKKTFVEIADLIDASPIDGPLFRSDAGPAPISFADY